MDFMLAQLSSFSLQLVLPFTRIMAFLLHMGLPLWFVRSYSNAVEMRLPDFCARPEKVMQFQSGSLGVLAPGVLFEGVPSQKPRLIAGKCHVVHLSLPLPGSNFQNRFVWGGSCVSQRPPDDRTPSEQSLQASKDRQESATISHLNSWPPGLSCCFILLSSARAVMQR